MSEDAVLQLLNTHNCVGRETHCLCALLCTASSNAQGTCLRPVGRVQELQPEMHALVELANPDGTHDVRVILRVRVLSLREKAGSHQERRTEALVFARMNTIAHSCKRALVW